MVSVGRVAGQGARCLFGLLLLVLLAAELGYMRIQSIAAPLHKTPAVRVDATLLAALRTGDIVLTLHDWNLRPIRNNMPAFLARPFAASVTLHVGVIWRHRTWGPCVVEATNGIWVNQTADVLDTSPDGQCTDCMWDELTGKSFLNGVRVIPLQRYVQCYGGRVFVRRLRELVVTDDAAMERMVLEWAVHQRFRTDMEFGRYPMPARAVGTITKVVTGRVGLVTERMAAESSTSGLICSELAVALLTALGVWQLRPHCNDNAILDGMASIGLSVAQSADLFGCNWGTYAGRRARLPEAFFQFEHIPSDLSSAGTMWARRLWGPEILLAAQ